jgi:hypothetical protein
MGFDDHYRSISSATLTSARATAMRAASGDALHEIPT